MPTPAIVLPAGDTPTAELAEVLGRAFADNPGYRALLHRSDDATRLRQTIRGMHWAVRATRRCGHVDIIREHGRLVAVALRFAPGQYPMRLDGTALMLGMGLCGGLRQVPRFERLDRFMQRHHPKAPHHYLYFIAVLPACQGRGLGGALLRHLTALADADAMPAYLETDTVNNVRLYERHGYRVDAEHTVPNMSGLHMWLMTRPPGGAPQ